MYLKLTNFNRQFISLDRESGKFQYVDKRISDVAGFSYLIKPNRLCSEYRFGSSRWFQIDSHKWDLSNKNVKCTYFRLFKLEFFSIQMKGCDKLKIRLNSRPPLFRAIIDDPTYDELDKLDDYFFYRVWVNWKKEQKIN